MKLAYRASLRPFQVRELALHHHRSLNGLQCCLAAISVFLRIGCGLGADCEGLLVNYEEFTSYNSDLPVCNAILDSKSLDSAKINLYSSICMRPEQSTDRMQRPQVLDAGCSEKIAGHEMNSY